MRYKSLKLVITIVGLLLVTNTYGATSQELLPIDKFYSWTYDGTDGVVTTEVLASKRIVNGVSTTGLKDSDGSISYVTNDQNGYREHLVVDTVGDTTTLIPPVKYLNAQPLVGDSISSSGVSRFNIAGIGIIDLRYRVTSNLVRQESVTVPAGTYDAYVVETTIRIFGEFNGVIFDIFGDSTSWLVEGVGDVRGRGYISHSSGNGISSSELQSFGTAPDINTPTDGSTLASSSETFNWINNNSPVNDWWLYIGTTPGANDIEDTGSLGSTTNYTSNVLPTDGNMVFARLFFRTNRAGWTSLDYSYSTSALPLPEITTPTDTTQLVADSATFNWITNGNYVSNWWLYLGTTEGGNDIYDSGNIDGATLSTTVSNLPNDGSPIYARLYYRGASITWKNADFTYTSVEVPRPTITSPSDSSTLAGDSETFSWQTNGYAVSEWWLYVGTSPGANDIVDSGSLGSATSLMVNNLPTDGSPVHARLYFRNSNGQWESKDFSYTAARPEITSPADEGVLTGSSETFMWNANGVAISEWWLYVGTSPGANDIVDSGSLGSATSLVVNNLPADGSTVYARLYYRNGSGAWKSSDFSYTAVRPEITAPADEGVLTGSSETFMWNANGSTVSEWWLYVGTSPGANDIVDSGSLGSATSLVVNGLPTDGSMVYARLYYRNGSGPWRQRDFSYTASN